MRNVGEPTMKKTATIIAWLLVCLIMGVLIALPVGDNAQITLGLLVCLSMIALWRYRTVAPLRLAFIVLGLSIVLRYVYWRTTSTLPPVSDLSGFIPGLILYIAELYCVAMMCVSIMVVADPLQRKPPAPVPADKLPTVDVFVPSYNESRDLLATTLAAAKAMDYPADKLNVFLLDDGGTDQKCHQPDQNAAEEARFRRAELMSLCDALGVHYLARARNEHAKAGNLNAGLQKSTGELVAVFDADHAPVREFLTETVGHFAEDERLFLVQTPHFFLNPDPIEKNLSTFQRMPSENEMFYSMTQRGLDKWNAAFFCGSAAVLRRTALTEANGFSGKTITEDCETALELHSRGWNSRYVDKPLIAGLQPETLDSFIGQRSRWCRGMIQILILKNPLLQRGLTIPQRLCYLSTAMFWLFPLPRLIFMIAPLFYLFFGIKIYIANIQEFLAYTTTYLAVSLMLQNYLFGKVRWPWVSELYEYMQSYFLAQAIFSVIVSPHKPTFNVTAKGMTLEQDHISGLARPYFAVFGLLMAGVVMTVWRNAAEPATSDLTLFVGAWNVFNLVLAGTALGAVIERRERRRTHRLAIARTGTMLIDDHEVQVQIDDASIGGVRVRPTNGHAISQDFNDGVAWLTIDPREPGESLPKVLMRIRRIAHDGKGPFLGLEYANLELSHYRVVADLMFSDGVPLERFRTTRRSGQNVLSGTLRFVVWGLREMGRLCRFIIASNGHSTLPASLEAPAELIAPHGRPDGRGAAPQALRA